MEKSQPQNQPVNDQPAPPQPQPTVVIQQVQTIKDLKGLSGWLMFFLICFACAALSMLSASVYSIFVPNNVASSIVTSIFAPFVAVSALLSVVSIAFQFKLARIAAITTYAVTALYTSILTLIAIGESPLKSDGSVWAGAIVGIFTSLIIYGLLVLYFCVSKRVKETLVKDIPKNIKTIAFSSALGFAALLAILGVIFSATAKKSVTSGDIYDDFYDSSYYDDDYYYY